MRFKGIPFFFGGLTILISTWVLGASSSLTSKPFAGSDFVSLLAQDLCQTPPSIDPSQNELSILSRVKEIKKKFLGFSKIEVYPIGAKDFYRFLVFDGTREYPGFVSCDFSKKLSTSRPTQSSLQTAPLHFNPSDVFHMKIAHLSCPEGTLPPHYSFLTKISVFLEKLSSANGRSISDAELHNILCLPCEESGKSQGNLAPSARSKIECRKFQEFTSFNELEGKSNACDQINKFISNIDSLTWNELSPNNFALEHFKGMLLSDLLDEYKIWVRQQIAPLQQEACRRDDSGNQSNLDWTSPINLGIVKFLNQNNYKADFERRDKILPALEFYSNFGLYNGPNSPASVEADVIVNRFKTFTGQ